VQSHLDGIEWSEEESLGIRDVEQLEVFIKTLRLFLVGFCCGIIS
jgi:hypothetical protein